MDNAKVKSVFAEEHPKHLCASLNNKQMGTPGQGRNPPLGALRRDAEHQRNSGDFYGIPLISFAIMVTGRCVDNERENA